jgi:SAM-dependent methyltransferase
VGLGLGNVRFVHSDFLAFQPPERFDIVLSVASAHYLVEQGRGVELFRAFRTWLKPNGLLLLFAPRSGPEIPSTRYLPDPFQLRDIFSAEMIRFLCREAGLDIRILAPVIGALGTVAQQLTQAATSSRALSLFTYPLQLALSEADRLDRPGDLRKASSSWLLVAS